MQQGKYPNGGKIDIKRREILFSEEDVIGRKMKFQRKNSEKSALDTRLVQGEDSRKRRRPSMF